MRPVSNAARRMTQNVSIRFGGMSGSWLYSCNPNAVGNHLYGIDLAKVFLSSPERRSSCHAATNRNTRINKNAKRNILPKAIKNGAFRLMKRRPVPGQRLTKKREVGINPEADVAYRIRMFQAERVAAWAGRLPPLDRWPSGRNPHEKLPQRVENERLRRAENKIRVMWGHIPHKAFAGSSTHRSASY
jgi:hypothetical protein